MNSSETLKIKNCLKSWHFSIDSKILLTTLNGNEKLLYITLCSYLSPSGDTCFPSIKRLTMQMSCSRRTIFRTLLELEEKGIIVRHEQFADNGRRIVNLYEVHEIPEEYFIQPEPEKEKKLERPEMLEKSVSVGSNMESQIEPGGGCQFDTGCQSGTGIVPIWHGDSVNMAHNHLPIEHKPKEIKHTQTFGLSAGAGHNKNGTPIAKTIPQYLNEVADYFLLKTGRDKLTDSEIETLTSLGQAYTLSRINREISVAAERFKTQGKSLKLLRMDYIQEALKYQNSTKKKPEPVIKKKESETLGFTLEDVLQAYRMGGEDSDDLPILCEMYRLSGEDVKKAFEVCGIKYLIKEEAG